MVMFVMLILLRNSVVLVLFAISGCTTSTYQVAAEKNQSLPQTTPKIPDKLQQVIPPKTASNALSTPQKKLKIKPSLGIYVDEHTAKNGVMILRFDSVKGKSTAEYFGMKRGDIIIWLGSCEVRNISTYFSCLDNFQPLQKIQIGFVRDGVFKKLWVELREKY